MRLRIVRTHTVADAMRVLITTRFQSGKNCSASEIAALKFVHPGIGSHPGTDDG
jgi:hypothetical protein